MNLRLKKVLAGLLWGSSICSAFSANVDWNKAFVVYEGVDASGVYERYTMGSPYLNMVAKREGSGLEIWAQPDANLVVGNELVLLFSKHLGSHTEDRWCRFSGPMLPFRLESIQNKINEWEGPDAGQFQIVPFDLNTYPELVNQR